MIGKIYRQEAIKAIKEASATFQIVGRPGFEKYQDEVRKICWEMADRYIKAIEAVPAAEENFLPEYEKVVRCKDCRHLAEARLFGVALLYCSRTRADTEEDDYCSHGQRREPCQSST